MFNTFKNCQTVFQNGCTIFAFLQAMYESSNIATYFLKLVITVFLILACLSLICTIVTMPELDTEKVLH